MILLDSQLCAKLQRRLCKLLIAKRIDLTYECKLRLMNFHQSFLFFAYLIPTNCANGHMYNPLMIIYGELLFAENMIMGAVLLYITALIHKISLAAKAAKIRLVAGSFMCGAFSLILFINDQIPPNAKAPLMILMEVAFAFGVCAVAFGKDAPRGERRATGVRRAAARILRLPITFILVTYFMGGMIMGLLLVTQQQGIYTVAGIYTGDMKAGMLALFVGIATATSKQIVKTVRKHKIINQHIYRVRLVIEENTIETEAFVDTGNYLKDPIKGRPVAIASGEIWEIMQRELMQKETMQSQGLQDKEMLTEERFTIVPYAAVGSRGILEAVRLDYMEIMPDNFAGANQEGGHRIKGCVIAKSDESFKLGDMQGAGHCCQLLISAEIVES